MTEATIDTADAAARAWAGEPIDLPTLPPGEITAITAAAIAAAERRVDAGIAASRAEVEAGRAPSFETLFGALDDAAREVAIAFGRGPAQYNMASDDAVRDAAFAAIEVIEQWRATLPMREDLARTVEAFTRHGGLDGLTDLEARYVERWRKDIRLAGGDLGPEQRETFARLNKRLLEIASAFAGNLAKPPRMPLSAAELETLPEGIRAAATPLDGEPGRFEIPVHLGVYIAAMTSSASRPLRERTYRTWNTQGIPENLDLIREAQGIRRELAQLAGYPSWRAYRAENLAAPDAEFSYHFITETSARLRPIVAADVAAMVEALRGEPGAPADLVMQDWDWRYADAIQRRALGADPAELCEYFELERVLDGLAELSATTFGIRLVPRPERSGWDPGVRPFDVVDAASGEVLAYLYMDPWARPGKQQGAWMEVLLPGGGRSGVRRPSTMSLVLNATQPGDGPALLGLLEVETLFHEFGHVMNGAVGHGPFVIHRSTWIPFDFIEGPSEFNGRWGLQPEVVRRYARHHVTGAPIPTELVEAVVRSESLNAGFDLQRTLAMAFFDALIHGETEVSVDEATRQAWTLRGLPLIEGTSIPASLTHIMAGAYDAALYGYAWSEVIRDDLLERFEAGGLLSAETGARYREAILDVAWIDDPVAGVNAFLGRPWSAEAFMRRAGGASA